MYCNLSLGVNSTNFFLTKVKCKHKLTGKGRLHDYDRTIKEEKENLDLMFPKDFFDTSLFMFFKYQNCRK
jgi:hypothetical protein